MKKAALLWSFVLLMVIGCKKDKEDGPPEINRQNVAGTYKLNTFKGSSGAVTVDYTQELEECEKDDLMVFNANGTFSSKDDGVKCNPPNEEVTGTWDVPSPTQFVLNSDIFAGLGLNNTFNLLKYDGKELEISQTVTYNGIPVTVTVNMRKQ